MFTGSPGSAQDRYAGAPGASGGAVFSYDHITIDDSHFESNRAGRGGAAYFAGDATVTRSSFVKNRTLGVYARPGGAIYTESQIDVRDCALVGNQIVDNWFKNHGHSVYGPAVLDRCTVVSVPPILSAPVEPEAGVYGATVRNSIVRGAGDPEVVDCVVTHSNILGGYPGTGNIDEDPLFWDAEGGDFHLRPGSPCIDAGDPTSPLDPDGSIADMGAFPFDPDYCPTATSYCTAGTTGNGCMATISATGTPSVSAGSGFDVLVSNVEGQKQGIIFWGLTGKAAPWGGGSSWLCVQAPAKRTGTQDSGGTAGQCDGSFSLDFNAWMAANPGKAPGPGEVIYMQAWFRDPPSPKTTSLSDGLRIVVCD